ncbi:2-succinyl-6-hydroxy-2,4-cyclohexadiene-1-carboxylate synthase [Rhodohalobacter barkolensis]|uniref:2-succinyl-6-hydroxy-2,4-cyclohexadiene-1-carboxylate synthase n=1 Tax=Rhodohalobacter barkolensis TaxID=2053187 RepID=A0A2N0VL66_9BACT|nr:2-succinyl-6-hydroxy-2,4-cyclohexadiene-1-carboxylate synthase [Rhodohalobacter barkolensis]PKD44938.1 2-succinyl-6-hydroxy-2,4-cyclohexadiene-1-carboxylate synthase [Rhodohalobacter barkolensis]
MKLYADGIAYHLTIHQSEPSLPNLILFHGFMGSGKVFEPLVDRLKSFCNPITIDLAGHGNTETPANTELFHADRQVAQLKSILDRLSFDRLFAFGYSMGGRLLFQLITTFPELFDGAILESTHCGLSSDKEKKQRITVDELRAESILNNFDQFLKEWINLPLFKHTPDTARKAYQTIMENQKPECMAASLRGFGSGTMPTVCDKLQDVQFPLYLIAGEYDQKYVDRMASIAKLCNDSTFQIVEKAGHRIHTDQPDTWIQILKNFITQHYV